MTSIASKVYTAENSGGEIVLILGEPGLGREEFQERALGWCRDYPYDDGDTPPHVLELYEWLSLADAGAWIGGEIPLVGETWKLMEMRAHFATVSYEYAGGGHGEFLIIKAKGA